MDDLAGAARGGDQLGLLVLLVGGEGCLARAGAGGGGARPRRGGEEWSGLGGAGLAPGSRGLAGVLHGPGRGVSGLGGHHAHAVGEPATRHCSQLLRGAARGNTTDSRG